MGGDQRGGAAWTAAEVSIHAPAWGATGASRRRRRALRFQSTPPHGGRLSDDVNITGRCKFQSTPPHGGRRARWAVWRLVCRFQSTPPHGGRPGWTFGGMCLARFNPRPRMGGDQKDIADKMGMAVSIHAPAWGATTETDPTVPSWAFQSTPPHGGRPAPCRHVRQD